MIPETTPIVTRVTRIRVRSMRAQMGGYTYDASLTSLSQVRGHAGINRTAQISPQEAGGES